MKIFKDTGDSAGGEAGPGAPAAATAALGPERFKTKNYVIDNTIKDNLDFFRYT